MKKLLSRFTVALITCIIGITIPSFSSPANEADVNRLRGSSSGIAAIVAVHKPGKPTGADKNRGWLPAIYRGLVVGTSTRADMLRVLGKPLQSGPSADQDPPKPIIWNDYGMVEGDLSGQLAMEFDSRTDRIVAISISPEKMSKEEAIKYFGNDYIQMGYEFCPDQSLDACVGFVYENPNSTEIDYLEYPSRGIAIHLDYQGNVNAIYYLDGPIGLASKAECKQASKKHPFRS